VSAAISAAAVPGVMVVAWRAPRSSRPSAIVTRVI